MAEVSNGEGDAAMQRIHDVQFLIDCGVDPYGEAQLSARERFVSDVNSQSAPKAGTGSDNNRTPGVNQPVIDHVPYPEISRQDDHDGYNTPRLVGGFALNRLKITAHPVDTRQWGSGSIF